MRLVFGEKDTPYEEARVVVLPVPYDLSLSFLPGARRGPEAILLASRELEPFLLELGAAPEEVGIHAAEPVPWVAGMAEESHRLIREEALRHLRAGKWVVALGGDHSVTHPLVQAHREALGDFSSFTWTPTPTSTRSGRARSTPTQAPSTASSRRGFPWSRWGSGPWTETPCAWPEKGRGPLSRPPDPPGGASPGRDP